MRLTTVVLLVLISTNASVASAQSVEDEPFVLRRTENGVFTLGGRVHRVMMWVDDGASTNGFFMDSDQGPTMLRADISNTAS